MVVDTDIIIRFITQEDDKKAKKFQFWLKKNRKITLTDVTLAEVYWVLKSFYGFEQKRIIVSLESLLNYNNIICNKMLLSAAVAQLKNYNISFVDAYVSAYSLLENEGKILSFDKDFDKIKGIKRVEP
jgi:predicted nucleic acid-binding protein